MAQPLAVLLEPPRRSIPRAGKVLLIDELWRELAQLLENSSADTQTGALLDTRFAEYLADSRETSSPPEEAFAWLGERKWRRSDFCGNG